MSNTNDMLINQMRWLELSHLSGVLSQEIPHDPTVGPPRRSKRIVTTISNENEETTIQV